MISSNPSAPRLKAATEAPAAGVPAEAGPQALPAAEASETTTSMRRAPASMTRPLAPARPTLWGLEPVEVFDRYWASRGVQVVRRGEPSEVVHGADLFLLTDPERMMLFPLRSVVNQMRWLDPQVLLLRLQDEREHGYSEVAHSDEEGRFVRFERHYGGADSIRSRIALTPDRLLALSWQSQPRTQEAWRMLRRHVPRSRREVLSIGASVYHRDEPEEVVAMLRKIVERWRQPATTIQRARRHGPESYIDPDASVDPRVKFVGPVWVGAGRVLEAPQTVVGPAVLWDDPAVRPRVEHVRWEEIEPARTTVRSDGARRNRRLPLPSYQLAKRVFDVGFALVALAVSLPLYPIIMLMIYLEDGRPFFFAHRRETRGGREFPCLKFRSMRKDAERIKQRIAEANQVDGPQFYIDDDPRITRVGAFLRRSQLDELPQFLNVLVGHMSIVGPRPSPRKENQYCPAWRETRLSVRPGITGLWQVKRTRKAGLDFQEWIRYDIEYVDNASFWLDLKIVASTVVMISRKAMGKGQPIE